MSTAPSPYHVILLKEGYSFTSPGGEQHADCTITLIKGSSRNVLVDTGNPGDGPVIRAALSEHGLTPDAIALVVCTHGHSDHVGNLNMFAHARCIVSNDISFGDTFYSSPLSKGASYDFDGHVRVMSTPGHTSNDVSVCVETANGDVIVIAGDLFENEADLKDESIWREVSENPELQEQHRNRVLAMADYIVPGHGPMFRVDKPDILPTPTSLATDS